MAAGNHWGVASATVVCGGSQPALVVGLAEKKGDGTGERSEAGEEVSLGLGERRQAEGNLRAGRNKMSLEQFRVLYKCNIAYQMHAPNSI